MQQVGSSRVSTPSFRVFASTSAASIGQRAPSTLGVIFTVSCITKELEHVINKHLHHELLVG